MLRTSKAFEPVGGIWPQTDTIVLENMIRQGSTIVANFGVTSELWVWSRGGARVHRSPVDPEQMVVDIDNDSVEELVVSFSGYGLWYHGETTGWQFLNAVVPEDMKPINLCP